MIKSEKERKYYNHKLIKEGIKSELNKPHKKNIKEFVSDIIGIIIGMILIDVIGTEDLISNNAVRFVVEILIIAAFILLINSVASAADKLRKNK